MNFYTKKRSGLECNCFERVCNFAFKCVHYTVKDERAAFASKKHFQYYFYKNLCHSSGQQMLFPIADTIGDRKSVFCLLLRQMFSYESKESLLPPHLSFFPPLTYALLIYMSQGVGKSDFLSVSLMFVAFIRLRIFHITIFRVIRFSKGGLNYLCKSSFCMR